jgi:hypothetical protein
LWREGVCWVVKDGGGGLQLLLSDVSEAVHGTCSLGLQCFHAPVASSGTTRAREHCEHCCRKPCACCWVCWLCIMGGCGDGRVGQGGLGSVECQLLVVVVIEQVHEALGLGLQPRPTILCVVLLSLAQGARKALCVCCRRPCACCNAGHWGGLLWGGHICSFLMRTPATVATNQRCMCTSAGSRVRSTSAAAAAAGKDGGLQCCRQQEQLVADVSERRGPFLGGGSAFWGGGVCIRWQVVGVPG